MARFWRLPVVPYIGTWIETKRGTTTREIGNVVPYIGTWIETFVPRRLPYMTAKSRTLYRYVD